MQFFSNIYDLVKIEISTYTWNYFSKYVS